ncbi:hypothetical protein [Kribbella sp. C-35]|uniref:hypothetical protein n=1 Tax=Kribbella sp. C-35 TaxID=2789276 RepID=UPI00397D460D
MTRHGDRYRPGLPCIHDQLQIASYVDLGLDDPVVLTGGTEHRDVERVPALGHPAGLLGREAVQVLQRGHRAIGRERLAVRAQRGQRDVVALDLLVDDQGYADLLAAGGGGEPTGVQTIRSVVRGLGGELNGGASVCRHCELVGAQLEHTGRGAVLELGLEVERDGRTRGVLEGDVLGDRLVVGVWPERGTEGHVGRGGNDRLLDGAGGVNATGALLVGAGHPGVLVADRVLRMRGS